MSMAIHMDCPKCGGDGSPDIICDFCGINMPLYEKAKHMSDVYYNKGLEFAKIRNLTAAMECLEASLQINKKNTKARNLLGLCFYEVGRIGEALQEWVISANYGDEDNFSRDYLDIFQEDLLGLEKYSEGLRNYNEALVFISQYSEDLAAIRLKRAVEIIPNFVEAMNLLALFYLKNGEKQKAAALVERVLAIDAENPFARRYYAEIFQKKAPMMQRPPLHSQESTGAAPAPVQRGGKQSPFGPQSRRRKAFGAWSPLYGILFFLAGLGAMFLFMYVLVLPSFLEDGLADARLLEAELNSRLSSQQMEIMQRDDTISRTEGELARYQGYAARQAEDNANLLNENRVNAAYIYLSRDLPHEALGTLYDVEVFRLSHDLRATYDFVRRTAMPVVEEYHFLIGQGYFNAGSYEEAKEALERAADHIIDDSVNAPHIFYFLGRIAEVQEDFAAAREYFQRVVYEFPASNRVTSARNRLDNLP